MGRIQEYSLINCAVNPQAGRERVTEYRPVLRAKRVLVVGGGVAGCEAARVLAERGHRPELYEQSGRLGGNLNAAGVPDFKEDDRALIAWYEQELKRLMVPVYFHTKVESELVKKGGYDAVILATGSVPKHLALDGEAPVVTASDVLLGEEDCGEQVIVVGGGLVGCETALWLAQNGKKVTIVEAMDKLMAVNKPLCHANSEMLERLIPFHKVEILTSARVLGYKDGRLKVSTPEKVEQIPCDTVISAIGFSQEDSLYRQLSREVAELYLLGDARRVSNIMYAVWDAFEVANHI